MNKIALVFFKLMMEGKVKSALRFATDHTRAGGVLQLDAVVMVKGAHTCASA